MGAQPAPLPGVTAATAAPCARFEPESTNSLPVRFLGYADLSEFHELFGTRSCPPRGADRTGGVLDAGFCLKSIPRPPIPYWITLPVEWESPPLGAKREG